MQLRLAFSIAIQVPFDILMLDEVLAVGDDAFQKKCFGVFDDLIQETTRRSSSSVMTLTTMKLYCDRALYLQGGVVRAIGPVDEVVEQYIPEPLRELD